MLPLLMILLLILLFSLLFLWLLFLFWPFLLLLITVYLNIVNELIDGGMVILLGKRILAFFLIAL